MEFRKMVLIILHAGRQRRHRDKEQAFGLSGRRRGWDDLREEHWNMYITICKIDDPCKFAAWSTPLQYSCLENPMDCSLSGSSIYRIFQARILEWFVISFSREFSWSKDRTWISSISCIGRQILYLCTTGKPIKCPNDVNICVHSINKIWTKYLFIILTEIRK